MSLFLLYKPVCYTPTLSRTFPGTLDVSVSRDTLGEEIVAVEQGREEWMVRGLNLEDDPQGSSAANPPPSQG